MRRSSCRYRLLLPLLALAGVTVVLLSRCGNAGNSGPAPGEADAKPGENPEPPADVDAWAGSFSRQIPPPATLRQDGAVLSDTLANGLRYLIMEQPNGEGLSLRLLVLAGSVHETEEELGFAHFVEHMAFRGTVHHPEGDALAMFERLGLKAGAHTNAATRPDKWDSSRLDEISSRIRALLEDLDTAGWTADEFQRATRPWGPWMRRHLRNPDTWILSPSQPGTIPPPGSLKPESLLLRQDAVKKLADEVLDVAAAVEVRIQAVEE